MSLFVSQQWFQRLEINERAGILYELYHNLPDENEEFLKEKHQKRYVHIPESIEEDLGIKLENYICIGFALFLFYQAKHKHLCKTSPQIRQELKSAINSKYLSKKRRGKFFSNFIKENTGRTIIENDQLILLESKAKRTRLDSRVYGRSEFVLSDLIRPIKAVKKLKEKKLEDLYKGLPQYSDWQSKLDATTDSESIFVCIMEESIMGLQEFVANEAKRNPYFELSEFGYKYCFMDVFTFTKAVEIVNQNEDLLLSDVLINYYMKAKRLDSNEGTSDMFDDYDIEYEKSFANQKFLNLIDKLRND